MINKEPSFDKSLISDLLNPVGRYFVFVLIFTSSYISAQRFISGSVFDESGEILIGTSIFSHLDSTGIITDIEGNFKISISNSAKKIRFYYIGFEHFDLTLTQDSVYRIVLKESCTKCWFDAQEVNIGLSLDILNKFSGGFIEVTSPGIFKSEVLKLRGALLQSDEKNKMSLISVEVSHLFSTCDFDMNLSFSYMHLNFGDQKNRTYGVYSELNFNRFTPQVGLVLLRQFSDDFKNKLGVSLGYGLIIGRPFNLSILPSSTIWKNDLSFNLDIDRYIKNNFTISLRGYKFRSASTISVGIKYEFGYFLKGQNYRFLHD
jgi:hypothetical protein